MAASVPVRWRAAIVGSDLTPKARLVAFVLSTHMNARGGQCFPALSTIARETGLARSTVQRALDELEDARYLARLSGGPKLANRYRALIPDP